MDKLNEKTVGAIVAQNWKAASVFYRYGIDFCCHGSVSLSEACASAHADEPTVVAEITASLAAATDPEADCNLWELDRLAEFIENKHHKYVADSIPQLMTYLNRICLVHGDNHPELLKIRDLFMEAAQDLTVHMKKEELMVFPFIKKMTRSQKQNAPVDSPGYGTIKNPIEIMMHDHEAEGNRLGRIAALSNDYTPPADACGTYKVTYAMLEEFEKDLHRHIHLENNILFPKAVVLENELVRDH